MKKLLLLSLLLSLLLLTGCELFLDEPSKGNINYVVVGLDYENDTYANGTYYVANNLEGTLNDAKEMSSALDSLITKTGRTGGKTFLMLQEGTLHDATTINDVLYPSVDHVTSKLTDIATTATENDLTIFYYSGHGEEDTGRLVLATTTGIINDEDWMEPLVLLNCINGIKGKKLIILDSCYSGQFVEESDSSLSMVYSDYDYYAKYFSDASYELSDMYVLSASANNNLSYEINDDNVTNNHHHGEFSYALLKGLGLVHTYGNDGVSVEISFQSGNPPAASRSVITVDSLYTYILDNQTIQSNKLYFYHQHPMTNGGAMDMVLFNF